MASKQFCVPIYINNDDLSDQFFVRNVPPKLQTHTMTLCQFFQKCMPEMLPLVQKRLKFLRQNQQNGYRYQSHKTRYRSMFKNRQNYTLPSSHNVHSAPPKPYSKKNLDYLGSVRWERNSFHWDWKYKQLLK